jgi:opacity protein-like surface antigen
MTSSQRTLSIAVMVLISAANVAAQEWQNSWQGAAKEFEPPPQETMTQTPSWNYRHESAPSRSRWSASSAYDLPFAVGFAAGVQYNSFLGSEADGNGMFCGGTLSVGGYMGTTKEIARDITLAFDVGYWQGDYSSTIFDRTYQYEGGLDYARGATAHGIITRKNEAFLVPLSLVCAYNYHPTDRLSLRVGAFGGATYYSLDSTFAWSETIYDPDHNQVGYDHAKFAKKSNDGFLAHIGAIAGISFNVTRSFALELQYRLTWTHNVTVGQTDTGDALDVSVRSVESDMLSHQVMLNAVWKF